MLSSAWGWLRLESYEQRVILPAETLCISIERVIRAVVVIVGEIEEESRCAMYFPMIAASNGRGLEG